MKLLFVLKYLKIYVDFFIDLVHTFTLKKLSSISGFLDYWSEINKKSIVISEDVNAKIDDYT